ncbi:hypothetical protein OHD62_26110 [Mesorhizobium sp. YC-39]|uniref:hypothetical protein n=1 Tax=unclassified Mesorhizobium TaxID=325217 RepID=UPI0021E7EB76|nr:MULTISPECIES: hypothetical protein [unclassified Mesorhizobium]MCV3208787.1 hypothetical protein [Mesorhizobium sp. YC-2]MCV3231864.1 hypothetical protein [Mesorhizobium sp. YC-39]
MGFVTEAGYTIPISAHRPEDRPGEAANGEEIGLRLSFSRLCHPYMPVTGTHLPGWEKDS